MCVCKRVYDILCLYEYINIIKDVKHIWSINFDTEDLGHVDIIVGIKFMKKYDDITLTQAHYAEKFLKKFNYFNVNQF